MRTILGISFITLAALSLTGCKTTSDRLADDLAACQGSELPVANCVNYMQQERLARKQRLNQPNYCYRSGDSINCN